MFGRDGKRGRKQVDSQTTACHSKELGWDLRTGLQYCWKVDNFNISGSILRAHCRNEISHWPCQAMRMDACPTFHMSFYIIFKSFFSICWFLSGLLLICSWLSCSFQVFCMVLLRTFHCILAFMVVCFCVWYHIFQLSVDFHWFSWMLLWFPHFCNGFCFYQSKNIEQPSPQSQNVKFIPCLKLPNKKR